MMLLPYTLAILRSPARAGRSTSHAPRLLLCEVVRYEARATLYLAAALLLAGCPPPVDPALLQPPPPLTEAQLDEFSTSELMLIADRTQEVWAQQARHEYDPLKDEDDERTPPHNYNPPGYR